MKIISTTKAPSAIGPYSQARQVSGFIFTSGQIALTPEGEFPYDNVEDQTKQVLSNLSAILRKANSSLGQIIKTTIYLVDMNDFEKVNKIYAEFFQDHTPARSTVCVKALPKGALVEIDAIAINEHI